MPAATSKQHQASSPTPTLPHLGAQTAHTPGRRGRRLSQAAPRAGSRQKRPPTAPRRPLRRAPLVHDAEPAVLHAQAAARVAHRQAHHQGADKMGVAPRRVAVLLQCQHGRSPYLSMRFCPALCTQTPCSTCGHARPAHLEEASWQVFRAWHLAVSSAASGSSLRRTPSSRPPWAPRSNWANRRSAGRASARRYCSSCTAQHRGRVCFGRTQQV